jgi:hypothetical protein
MARKNPFRWHDRPPVAGKCITIFKVQHSVVYRYVVLGDRLWARDVHWTGRHSAFCTMDKDCQRCKDQMPKRAVAFLHVTLPNFPNEECFLELTPEGANQFLDGLKEKETMRGLVIMVQRARPTIKSPIRVEVIDRREDLTGFPLPADPTPTLIRLWRING